MSNSLNRNIISGEVVVIDKKNFKPEYKALKHRLFVCRGGFGLQANTMGGKIFGYHVSDGERCYWRGEEIDAKATKLYQKKHPTILHFYKFVNTETGECFYTQCANEQKPELEWLEISENEYNERIKEND